MKAKKICIAFLLLFFCFSVVACSSGTSDIVNADSGKNIENTNGQPSIVQLPLPKVDRLSTPVLPPNRLPEKKLYYDYLEYPTLPDVIERAEVIAHVKIGSWIMEDDERTTYHAEVIELLKGAADSEIAIMQLGNSNYIYGGYPLYTYGNELLLFLKKSDTSKYDDTYIILGGNLVGYYFIKSDSGDVYLTPVGAFQSATKECISPCNDPHILELLDENFYKSDPIRGRGVIINSSAFLYADVKNFVEYTLEEK